MVGSNVPLAPDVIPVPLHTPPAVAAVKLNAELPVQIAAIEVIVASELELTVTITVSVEPHIPGVE